MSEIKIVINKDVVAEYLLHYFNKYPKRKKAPITKPIHPSLNDWMIMPRFKMNSTKQAWKEFVVWVVERNNLTGMMINTCNVTVTYFFGNKRRRDADNFTPKNVFDGFTESGLLIDDDFGHVETLTIKGGYSKEDPRTEFVFSNVTFLDENGEIK